MENQWIVENQGRRDKVRDDLRDALALREQLEEHIRQLEVGLRAIEQTDKVRNGVALNIEGDLVRALGTDTGDRLAYVHEDPREPGVWLVNVQEKGGRPGGRLIPEIYASRREAREEAEAFCAGERWRNAARR